MSEAVSIPDHLKCPLSLELFRDPVVISTDPEGHCFEKEYAERVLRCERPLNPITRQTIHDDATLVTNRVAKYAVEDFLNMNPTFTPPGWRCRDECR